MARAQVDKKQVNTMNLQVLQRMDPEIEEVLRAVSHVALYQLDVKKMEWVRAGLERRSPVHTIVVHAPSAYAALAPSAQTDVQLRWRGRRRLGKRERAGLGAAAGWNGRVRVVHRSHARGSSAAAVGSAAHAHTVAAAALSTTVALAHGTGCRGTPLQKHGRCSGRRV
jgi:hypothetical protein